MEKFKGKYRIESNRLRYWDYSWPGFYFITICTINRECFLGEINARKMTLSALGEIVKNQILKMPGYKDRVKLDEWVIMPNHIHLLIELTDGDYGIDGIVEKIPVVEKIHEFSLRKTKSPKSSPEPWWYHPDYKPTIDEIKQYRKQRRKMLIPKIIGKMKMQTSGQINQLRNTPGTRNWQLNYHDHIVRNQVSCWRIKQYIINNPVLWDTDKFNPDSAGSGGQ